MIDIARQGIANRVLGESLATLSDDEGNNIQLPLMASDFQEIKQGQELSREYRFAISFQNEFFNMNPFFSIDRFSHGKKFIDEQIGITNNWIEKSQASKSAYAPKFSREIVEKSKEIDMTARISMGSKASFTSIRESPTLNGTRRLIEKYKSMMKNEGIEKDMMLILGMGQDEDDFELKYALAKQLGIKAVMSEWDNPKERWRNYRTVANYHSSKIVRIVANVPKAYLGRSAMLPLGILLGDVVAHAPIIGGGKEPPKGQKRLILTPAQRKRIAITNASRFNIEDNGLYTQANCKKENIIKTNCACEPDIFAGDTVEDFFREFNNNLYDAVGVHNTQSEYEAIVRLRGFIGNGLDKAFNMRIWSKKILEELYHISLNQRKI